YSGLSRHRIGLPRPFGDRPTLTAPRDANARLAARLKSPRLRSPHISSQRAHLTAVVVEIWPPCTNNARRAKRCRRPLPRAGFSGLADKLRCDPVIRGDVRMFEDGPRKIGTGIGTGQARTGPYQLGQCPDDAARNPNKIARFRTEPNKVGQS